MKPLSLLPLRSHGAQITPDCLETWDNRPGNQETKEGLTISESPLKQGEETGGFHWLSGSGGGLARMMSLNREGPPRNRAKTTTWPWFRQPTTTKKKTKMTSLVPPSVKRMIRCQGKCQTRRKIRGKPRHRYPQLHHRLLHHQPRLLLRPLHLRRRLHAPVEPNGPLSSPKSPVAPRLLLLFQPPPARSLTPSRSL